MPRESNGNIKLDTGELSPNYVRLMKTLHNTLTHLLTTNSEKEYFEHSAEALRLCASLIQQAQFAEEAEGGNIPYSEQVLEFSIATLQEYISGSKVITYDC